MTRHARRAIAHADAEHLCRRIGTLRVRLENETPPAAWLQEDLGMLTLECAALARLHLDMPALERALHDETRLDVDSLEAVLQRLRAVPGAALRFQLPDGTWFEGGERLETLQRLAVTVRSSDLVHPESIALTVSFRIEPALGAVLLALDDNGPIRNWIIEQVLKKTRLLSDKELVELWSAIEGQFDPEREVHFDRASPLVPKGFLRSAAGADGRKKLAQYWVEIRPKLERARLLAGEQRMPAQSIGAARALLWSGSPHALDARERALLVTCSRLGVCWEEALDGDHPEDLAAALELKRPGPVLGGQLEAVARRRVEGPGPTALTMTHELDTLVDHVISLVGAPSPLESVLRNFKLAREVEMPKDLMNAPELPLQRKLIAFLLERGYAAMGTQLGPSQVDIRVDDSSETVIVEVKRFSANAKPSAMRRLQHAATQLLSYMDQAPLRRHGVLAVFNFSAAPLFAPATAFRGRLVVVPINMCSTTPSKRASHVELVETDAADRLFDVVVRDNASK